MNNTDLIIAVVILLVVVAGAVCAYIRLIKLNAKKNRLITIDVRAQFTKKELNYIEAIMSKYRCTFDELALLGAWKFYDEGRNVFDAVDDRRSKMNFELAQLDDSKPFGVNMSSSVSLKK